MLHEHALKRKIIRFNNNPFMIKVLRNAKCTGQNLKKKLVKQEQRKIEPIRKNRGTCG